ncbi:MAG: ASKHA domain-containing protein [Clostridiales Family XIII bacterium]|jgi:uncharacterized 2Fe-2S/4Fe-4S cluster protein (DUF4445 family)|nr:ASKHA domain-containing protein [Clostridiales Family XIII bacterium]
MGKPLFKVLFPGLGVSVSASHGERLLDVIRENGIGIVADCGGRGKCGKCRVVVDGEPRLACETQVVSDISVTLPDEGSGAYAIQIDSIGSTGVMGRTAAGAGARNGSVPLGSAAAPPAIAADMDPEGGAAIAIDIGTTTIVAKLIGPAGEELAVSAELNDQRPYGADVVSRINMSMDDASVLSAIITKQLDGIIGRMVGRGGVAPPDIKRVVLAGNTTMCYILLGLPCRSIGVSPFKAAYPFKAGYSYREVFGTDTLAAPVRLIPFVSAYVGGDIVAGLVGVLAARGETPRQSEQPGGRSFMLVDMGTNGEIAYCSGEEIVCTATAAGPAFEGGNISCGSGSVEGAISEVAACGGSFECRTIGNAPARSVCGSGLLYAMACFLREGIIAGSGKMCADSPYVKDKSVRISDGPTPGEKGVSITQKDVREFQLAKSAVRTGVDVLIGEFGGIPPDTLYLAGGFGQNLDPESAFAVGLLPETLRGRVVPVGNSSLAGTVLAAADEGRMADAVRVAGIGREINLASHPKFNELFLAHMGF